MRFFHRFHLSPLSLSVDKARTSNNHYNHSIMIYIILSTWLSLYHSTCFLFFFCFRYCSIRRLYKLMYHPLSGWISCFSLLVSLRICRVSSEDVFMCGQPDSVSLPEKKIILIPIVLQFQKQGGNGNIYIFIFSKVHTNIDGPKYFGSAAPWPMT